MSLEGFEKRFKVIGLQVYSRKPAIANAGEMLTVYRRGPF